MTYLRVLEELVSAGVDAVLLSTMRRVSSPTRRTKERRSKRAHLLGREGLGGEIVAARVEASLYEVGVEVHKVLHLRARGM